MSETIVLAKFLGIFFVVFGIGILLNRQQYTQLLTELPKSASAQIIFALIPLFLGSYIVLTQCGCSGNLDKTVTILGWLFLAGGVFRTWFPKLWLNLAEKFTPAVKFSYIAGSVVALGGAALFYFAHQTSQMLQ